MFGLIENNSDKYDKSNYIYVLVKKECEEHDYIIGDILVLESIKKESLNKRMMFCSDGIITFDKTKEFDCLFSVKSIIRRL